MAKAAITVGEFQPNSTTVDDAYRMAPKPMISVISPSTSRGGLRSLGMLRSTITPSTTPSEADGRVDKEDPAPEAGVHQPAAEDGADGGRDDGGHAKDAEGETLFLHRKDAQQERNAQGQRQATAYALDGARAHQQPDVGRKARHQRAHDKDGEAGEIDALDAKAVGHEACQRRGDADRQHVDADDPLRFAQVRAEFLAQGLKRHVDDRGVENHHEDAKDDDAEHLPLIRQPALPWARRLRPDAAYAKFLLVRRSTRSAINSTQPEKWPCY